MESPENLTWEEAAVGWMMFVTASGALLDIANVQAGQTMLNRYNRHA